MEYRRCIFFTCTYSGNEQETEALNFFFFLFTQASRRPCQSPTLLLKGSDGAVDMFIAIPCVTCAADVRKYESRAIIKNKNNFNETLCLCCVCSLIYCALEIHRRCSKAVVSLYFKSASSVLSRGQSDGDAFCPRESP